MFKLLIVSNCMPLFNTSIAQHVSVYLAIIKCFKIVREIATLLYTVIPRIDTFKFKN
jgi:hypothetical protein